MGQSEMEYLLNTGSFYRAITQPTPGNGNLIVFTQDPNGSPPVRTVVNSTTVAAGEVNPAMAAMSAFLAYVEPSKTFVVGDGAVTGTTRGSLFDDANTERSFADFEAVNDLIVSEFGKVDSLIECWYNADSSRIATFRDNFWPMYFGTLGNGTTFTLGTNHAVSGSDVDHCLWDSDAASSSLGRGIFRRSDTRWHILTPMPFWNGPTSPTAELLFFSEGDQRLTEPDRATMHALSSNSQAQSVNLVVGPSAHITKWTGIHPDTDDADGQILLMWPIALSLLRRAGRTINEPVIESIDGPSDGSYVDVVVSLPNGGNLTTLRTLRSEANPTVEPPHYQDVVGFEITRSTTRRPVYKTSETSYPADYRGTVVIQDAGSGTPRKGRVRITPTNAFSFPSYVSYLRGQGSAILQMPRDSDAELYKDMLIEHIPSLYDATALYPFEGIAVRPYQEDLQTPVSAPAFTARSTTFNGTTSSLSSTSLSFAGSNAITFSCWLRFTGTWDNETIVQVREGTNSRFTIAQSSLNRLTFTISGLTNYTTPTNTFVTNQWHHIYFTVNANAGGDSRYQVYVDGVEVGGTKPVVTGNLTMNGQTLTRLSLGNAGGVNTWVGDLGHVWLDFTQSLEAVANIPDFLLSKNPVDLGSNGQLVTGTAPMFYLDGGASMTNLGTAGALTATDLTAGGDPVLP
jgi:hypothetical protein